MSNLISKNNKENNLIEQLSLLSLSTPKRVLGVSQKDNIVTTPDQSEKKREVYILHSLQWWPEITVEERFFRVFSANYSENVLKNLLPQWGPDIHLILFVCFFLNFLEPKSDDHNLDVTDRNHLHERLYFLYSFQFYSFFQKTLLHRWRPIVTCRVQRNNGSSLWTLERLFRVFSTCSAENTQKALSSTVINGCYVEPWTCRLGFIGIIQEYTKTLPSWISLGRY